MHNLLNYLLLVKPLYFDLKVLVVKLYTQFFGDSMLLW